MHFSISTSDTGSISGRLWKTMPRSGRAYPEPWPLCFQASRLHLVSVSTERLEYESLCVL